MSFRPKTEVLKKSKNENFSKGSVHGFCQYSNILSRVLICQITSGKIVF